MNFRKVIAGALYYCYLHRAVLARALAWPFLVFVLIGLIGHYFEVSGIAVFLLGIASLAVQAIFAITTHRIVLLGPGSVPRWGIVSWRRRETFYVLHIFALGLMALPAIILGFIPFVGIAVVVIGLSWLWGRFSLVFPAIAVEQSLSFGESWELTRDYQWLMCLVVIVVPILTSIPSALLDLLPHTFLLSSLLSAFVVVFEVAALSMAFQLISTESEPPAS